MKNHLLIPVLCGSLFTQIAHSQELEWSFATAIGTANNSIATLATDSQNNFIIGGILQGAGDFDPNAGTTQLTSSGLKDAYIAKYDEDKNLLWAYTFGGDEDEDIISDIVVDDADNIYIGGFFTGTVDFDPGAGEQSLTSHPMGVGTSAFVLKLDANGNFLWVKDYGVGNIANSNKIMALALDNDRNLIVGGKYYSNGNFPMVFEEGNPDAELNEGDKMAQYVLKINENGEFIWVKRMVAHSIKSIEVDAANSIYITGEYTTSGVYYNPNDMNPDPNVVETLPVFGQTDIFICKLNESGEYQWSNGMGNAYVDNASKLVVDNNGNVSFIGTFVGEMEVDPSENSFLLNFDLSINAYIIQYSSGGTLNWAAAIGDENGKEDVFYDITVDSGNNLYIAGFIGGPTDMNPGAGDSIVGTNAQYRPVMLKLKGDGEFVYAQYYATNTLSGNYSHATAISLATDGSVYLGGNFAGLLDSDAGEGEANLTSTGFTDLFVIKLHNEVEGGQGGTSGITEHVNTLAAVAYPNPGADFVLIKADTTEKFTVRVMNQYGQVISSETSHSNEHTLSTATFAAGIYFIEVAAEGNHQVIKWVKE